MRSDCVLPRFPVKKDDADFVAMEHDSNRDSQPELYPSSGESRCFLFLKFQLNPGHPPCDVSRKTRTWP